MGCKITTKIWLLYIFEKCQFHKNEIYFLGFVILAQSIKMKEEKIKAVKT